MLRRCSEPQPFQVACLRIPTSPTRGTVLVDEPWAFYLSRPLPRFLFFGLTNTCARCLNLRYPYARPLPTGVGDRGDGLAGQVVSPERGRARPGALRRRLGPAHRGRCPRVPLEGCSHVLQPCQGAGKRRHICGNRRLLRAQKQHARASPILTRRTFLLRVTGRYGASDARWVPKRQRAAIPWELLVSVLLPVCFRIAAGWFPPVRCRPRVCELHARRYPKRSTSSSRRTLASRSSISSCLRRSLPQASHRLHNRMLKRVIRAPILFFDSNPVGRWDYTFF